MAGVKNARLKPEEHAERLIDALREAIRNEDAELAKSGGVETIVVLALRFKRQNINSALIEALRRS